MFSVPTLSCRHLPRLLLLSFPVLVFLIVSILKPTLELTGIDSTATAKSTIIFVLEGIQVPWGRN